MGWKEELDTLKRYCLEREAPVLPDVLLEWFDMGRRGRVNAAYLDDLQQRIAAWRRNNPNPLDDWRFHTDAYGWRVKMQPYRRKEDGDVFVLVEASREQRATLRDFKNLAMMIKHLGGDYTHDLLLHAADPHGPAPRSFWSWSSVKERS